jgi:hypothetical protein
MKQVKIDIKAKLEILKLNAGQVFENVLGAVECSLNGNPIVPCTLEHYENKDVKVVLHGEDLTYSDDPNYPSISSTRIAYIDAILAQIEQYFPGDICNSFSVFNPKTFPLPGQPWYDFG